MSEPYPTPPITWQGRDAKGNVVDVTSEVSVVTQPPEVAGSGGLPSQWVANADGQVTANADNADEAVLTVKAADGSESSGDLIFEVQGETGTSILSVDPYGQVTIWGAVVDPTNGGGVLTIRQAGPSHAFIFKFNADDGNGGSSAQIGVAATTLGFFGKSPVARPTGVAVTAEAVHAALVSLGLITA